MVGRGDEGRPSLSLSFFSFPPHLAFPSVSRAIQIERTGDESDNTDLKVALTITSSLVSQSVATGDKEGQSKKLEKLWPAFSSFYSMPA